MNDSLAVDLVALSFFCFVQVWHILGKFEIKHLFERILTQNFTEKY